jgi:hypothetical protein
VNFEPPTPAASDQGPPAPGFAQQLVARSGFVVYEGGRTVFDESVLVYRARTRKHWPDFDISDHVGRALAVVRVQGPRSLLGQRRPSEILDLGGSRLLRVRPINKMFSQTFEISGVANAHFVAKGSGRTATIEANGERFGAVAGSSFRGMANSQLSIVDHADRQVGVIKSYRRGGLMRRVDDYVVSIEPTLRGPLRRSILAIPTVVAMIRRAQEQAAS